MVLSSRAQTVIVALTAGAIAVLILSTIAAQALLTAPEEAVTHAASNSSGTFKLTAAQMEYVTTAPVQSVPFRGQQTTEGVIALDDNRTVQVFSPYSGRVARLSAAPGDVVAPGTPLMTVEATEIVQAQGDLTTAANALETARAQLKLAETAAQRQRDLYEAKAAALKDLESAEADLVNARARLRTADSDHTAAQNRMRILGKSDREIATLEKQSAVALDREAVIRAPFAGTVIQRQVGVGQYIQANAANPLYVIGDLSKVWLIANVRESEVSTVKIGQDVDVRVPAYPDRVFHARITYIAASVDPATHRLPVRAEVENPDGALRPQMFASFEIVTDSEHMALAVPDDAVVYEGTAAHVWVMQADKSLVRRQITPGRRQSRLIEVVAGLVDGDEVVTSGPLFIDHAVEST
jgi:cobalt-zinc-cadmium efflux system membrane fusion protein